MGKLDAKAMIEFTRWSFRVIMTVRERIEKGGSKRFDISHIRRWIACSLGYWGLSVSRTSYGRATEPAPRLEDEDCYGGISMTGRGIAVCAFGLCMRVPERPPPGFCPTNHTRLHASTRQNKFHPPPHPSQTNPFPHALPHPWASAQLLS